MAHGDNQFQGSWREERGAAHRYARLRSSMLLPTPLRPMRPYRVPAVSCRWAPESRSLWPMAMLMSVMSMSLDVATELVVWKRVVCDVAAKDAGGAGNSASMRGRSTGGVWMSEAAKQPEGARRNRGNGAGAL